MLALLIPIFAALKQIPVRAARIAYTNRNAAYYALTCIAVFTLVYKFIGFKKHFDTPDYIKGKENTWFNSLYTSVLAQSNAMPDSVPKTTLARWLFMLQVSTGWIWFLLFA